MTARSRFQFRTRILSAGFLLLVLIFVWRLFDLQIIHGAEYRAEASGQYVSEQVDFFDRGSIFFRTKDDGLVAAATMKREYTVAVVPKRVEDVESALAQIETVLDVDDDVFRARAAKQDDPYEEIMRNVNETVADALSEMEIPGVLLVPTRTRFYPGDVLAAQVIGFVGYDGDVRNGRYGVERYYEDVLARSGEGLYLNSFAELFANVRELIFVPANEREGDVVSTIEPSVELALERALETVRERWQSKHTSGIIINPQTGAIYAMASNPSFNPNDLSDTPTANFVNPLVENVHEMGSILKPLTIAAGLDSGAIESDDTYNDKGSRTFDGYTIYNYDKRARGVTPIQEILSQSLNVGIAHVVEQMGSETLVRYFTRYGLREETGIDLPNETANLTDNLDNPRMIEYVTAGYGQGLALSPIAVVRALATLPDGIIEDPYVVDSIRLKSGITHTIARDHLATRVLKEETAEEITRMLVKVVDEALVEGNKKMEHYSIAAKTGTAQIAKPGGGYYDDRYLHTFFGYFPAYNPQFLIFLLNEEPVGAPYASQTLTDPFFELTEYLINYYEIPPDR